MKFLIALLALSAISFGATLEKNVVPTTDMETQLNKQWGPLPLKYSLGKVIKQAHNTAVGVLDFSRGSTSGSIDTGIHLPNKAIIRQSFLDVITQPTSAAATDIAFTAQSAGDLYAYTAKGSLTTGIKDGVVEEATESGYIKLTAARTVYAVVSGSALTAGKIKIFVDYVVSE